MDYEFVKLGTKYGGRCLVCGTQTGDRAFELEDTLLYQAAGGGKYAVVHAHCAGARLVSHVGGRRGLRNEPKSPITAA